MLFDPSYLPIFIISLILMYIPQMIVKSTFGKFSKVRNQKGYTGAEVAKGLLKDAGVYNVGVEAVGGKLTDYYDPSGKVIRLSDDVYSSNSIAALGVAAHEAGHAIQDNKGYVPMQLRAGIFPAVMFGQNLGPILVMIAIVLQVMLHAPGLSTLVGVAGIAIYGAVVLFQIVTLPVELNASSRAIQALVGGGYLAQDEIGGARKVLNAAAMTYLAAALIAILNLLYYIWLIFGRNRD